MKTYEIYEIANRNNKMIVAGKNYADACKGANINPYKFKVVSWAWAE